MELVEARRLANDLIAQHQLSGWSFRFDHARQRCGSCDYANAQISLSRHFAQLNSKDEVYNTLLHEIAHAMAGPRVGHGPKWQSIAKQIGARAEATNGQAEMPKPKWSLACNRCKKTVALRHRRMLDLNHTRCGYCGPPGELSWQAL